MSWAGNKFKGIVPQHQGNNSLQLYRKIEYNQDRHKFVFAFN